MKTRVILADDHTLLRAGLRGLLAAQEDLEVAGEAADGEQAVELARELEPEVVVMDVGMPGMGGIAATLRIRELLPATRVVALSIHTDWRYVSAMLRAGATGYLPKDCALEELVEAIRTVREGGIYMGRTVQSEVARNQLLEATTEGRLLLDRLSPREHAVLVMIAEGRKTKDIAEGLGIGVKTVETFRHNLMNKLRLHSVAELTRFAIREGIVSLDR